MLNGWLITFEGPEGGGKSTQVQRLAAYLRSMNLPCTLLREPGGTPIGDRIRQILLDPTLREMTQRTEILLYAASRAQLVEERILPALKRGDVVLCDRFVDSSLVYQGYAPEWDLDEVKAINRIATGGLRPHRTYLLDLPVDESERRLKKEESLRIGSNKKGKDTMSEYGKAFSGWRRPTLNDMWWWMPPIRRIGCLSGSGLILRHFWVLKRRRLTGEADYCRRAGQRQPSSCPGAHRRRITGDQIGKYRWVFKIRQHDVSHRCG